MKKILIVTSNANKVREFKEMLEPLGYEVVSLRDLHDDEDVPEASVTGAVVGSADAKRSGFIIEGLGGRANIVELDCCATRLRVTVKDGSLVRERLLKESGCRGVLQSGTGVQVIYGPQVTVIKNELEEVLNC